MVQTVSDSSRYFVIKPTDGPHLGLGFSDRSDSFDLNMALNDHFKSLRLDEEIAKEEEEPREQLDLSLKEGQTIKVNINIPRKSNRERSRSPAANKIVNPVLPPPSAASMLYNVYLNKLGNRLTIMSFLTCSGRCWYPPSLVIDTRSL